MSEKLKELFLRCNENPAFEAQYVSKRPLRGVQAEIIKRVEKHVAAHDGGVVTIQSSRQTGKNETSALLQRRHLWRNQNSLHKSSWIRTAPTHEPQIVNSKKRLEELMRVDRKNVIGHPLFLNKKIQKSEGYIWKLGNATVEFMSSGPHSNVVGATASECLDMDEAHFVDRKKLDEDFMPFVASTNAVTLLWGVAANGLDAIEAYRQVNIENKRLDLNLYYPCDVWMEVNPIYAAHVNGRVQALGYDHPIIKTQYRLLPVANEGTFLNRRQVESLLNGQHERLAAPIVGRQYEFLIDVAGGNEEFDPDDAMKSLDTDSDESTDTDSTIVWIYEVTQEVAKNNLFPVIRLVNMVQWTGVPLPVQEPEIVELIEKWNPMKVTVDGVGVGRHLAESLEQKYGTYIVKKYIANSTTVSEDCFDLLARLNYSAVKMFKDDESKEYKEFVRQLGWTKYQSARGKMNLIKPKSDKHIDMVKAITYINQNSPDNIVHEILFNESSY